MESNSKQLSIIRFAPFLFFVSVWFIVLFLYRKGYYNIHQVSSDTLLLIYFSIAAFTLSYFVFVVFDKEFQCSSIIRIDQDKILRTILILTLISLIGVYFKATEIAKYFNGFDIYYTNPLKVRLAVTNLEDFQQLDTLIYKFSSYFINFGMISTIYAGIYFVKVKKSWLILLLPIITSGLSSLVTFSRFTFITGITFLFLSIIFVSLFSTKAEKKIIKLKLFLSGVIVTVFVLTMIIGIYAARTFYSDNISDLLLESIYFYLTGGIVALDNFLNTPFTHTYGASSFRSLATWLDLIGLWPFEEVFETHNDFTKVAPDYAINTYTFLKSIYQDFGFYGSTIVMAIWAYLAKLSVKKLMRNFNLYNLFFSIVISFSLIMTFFSFYFQGISLLVFWIIALFVANNSIAKDAIEVLKAD